MSTLEGRAARTARLRRYLAWAVLGLLLILIAWTLLVATPVTGATVFTPPASYRAWWAEVEQCSGRRGDYDAVTWERAESPTVHLPDGGFAKAFHFGSNNTIVLARPYLDDARIVRHEMLHALLYPTDGHPREWYVVRCGKLVELSE